MSVTEVSHPDDAKVVAEVTTALSQTNAPELNYTGCFIHANGNTVWGAVRAVRVYGADGDDEYLSGWCSRHHRSEGV